MKIVKESLYEFSRSNNPKSSLGIGRIGSIRNFFRNLDIPDEYYTITGEQIIFGSNLDLSNCTGLTSLPEGIKVCTNIFVKNDQLELKNWINNSKFKNNLKII